MGQGGGRRWGQDKTSGLPHEALFGPGQDKKLLFPIFAQPAVFLDSMAASAASGTSANAGIWFVQLGNS